MSLIADVAAQILAEQNDLFRTRLTSACLWRGCLLLGRVVATSAITDLRSDILTEVLTAVRGPQTFTLADDPHGEHDFGVVEVAPERDRVRVIWKIDYYDEAYEAGSPDPSDPAVTRRVLTLMLVSEW